MDAVAVLIPVLVLVVFGLVVAVAVHTWRQAAKRREELAAWGFKRGLTYTAEDPFGLDRFDFHLFSLGDGRGVENVLAGTWEGMDVRIADYWYYEQQRNGNGGRSRTYYRFSVVLTPVAAALPHVRVQRESAFSRLADRLGFRDIEFESEEFNRRFQVKADDKEFAYKLVDARMMHWLLATAGKHCYEVNGQWLLAYAGRLAPAELNTLLYAAKGFLGQVPRLVWADYGTDDKETS